MQQFISIIKLRFKIYINKFVYKMFGLSIFSNSRKISKPKIFNPHSTNIICLADNFIQATFIDPGTVSCAFRTVKFYYEQNNIENVFFGILKFGKTIEEVLIGVETELTPLSDILINSHYIVIESQPLKRKDVFRTYQHLISFMLHVIKNKGVFGVVVEIDLKIKTVWIGGPVNKTQNGGISIKKWTQNKALEILNQRNDTLSLSIISSSLSKGREDLSDVVCYEYAWWSYYITRKEIPKIIFSI